MVSEHDPWMAKGMRVAQMEELLHILQRSQVELKEAYECHGKLLTKILRCLENLRPAEVASQMTLATVTPFLREKMFTVNFIRDKDEHPKVPYNHFSNELPIISLTGIDSAGEQAEVCRKIKNELFRLYGKCGRVSVAHRLFDKMSRTKLDSWNLMMLGFASNGQTFVAFLFACASEGVVGLGFSHFSQSTIYLFDPGIEH